MYDVSVLKGLDLSDVDVEYRLLRCSTGMYRLRRAASPSGLRSLDNKNFHSVCNIETTAPPSA